MTKHRTMLMGSLCAVFVAACSQASTSDSDATLAAPSATPSASPSDPFCDGYGIWAHAVAVRNASDNQGGTYWSNYGWHPPAEDATILAEIRDFGVTYVADVEAYDAALEYLATTTDDEDSLAAIDELRAASAEFFAPIADITSTVTSFQDYHDRGEPLMQDPKYQGGHDLGALASGRLTAYAQERCAN